MDAHPEAVEAVSEILSRVGYDGIAVDVPLDDRPHVVKAYLVYDRLSRVRVRRTKEALGHLRAFGLGPIGEVRLRTIAEEDWLEGWKASIVPLRIGAFLVCPTWIAPEDAIPQGGSDEATVLSLDPGMAFGTGLHPTTQQCLAALSTFALGGRSVFDVGTGSGILAIAAAKRGAAPVVAVDTDLLAVAASRENAARNGASVDVRLGSAADVEGVFDVVIANIVAPVLRDVAADLRARLAPTGTLLVAGIVAEAESLVCAALGLRVLERDQQGDWVSLVLRG